MNNIKKIIMISNMIFDLENDHEKAGVMADGILQDYFDSTDDNYKRYIFNKTEVEFSILQDYIIEMGEKIAGIKKILDEWYMSEKEKEGSGTCQSE